jgi:hypothetical protein
MPCEEIRCLWIAVSTPAGTRRTRGSRSDIGAKVCGEADSSPVAAQRVVVLGEQAGFSMPGACQARMLIRLPI